MTDKYMVGDEYTGRPEFLDVDNSELMTVIVDGVELENVETVNIGGGYVVVRDMDRPQPFSCLGSSNPDDFRIATLEEIIQGMRDMGIHQFISIKDCMDALKVHMKNDEPEKPGSYAHGWHCNIAMSFYDELMSLKDDKMHINHGNSKFVANRAASRFMRVCFDVETGQ